MSVANYLASIFEHTQILVSVKCSGDVNSESVKFVLEHLSKHKTVVINDAGCTINVLFSQEVSYENCEWGSFQAHRQVCGFIYIAEALNQMDAALIIDKFNNHREEYGPGLYHSRCLIFGIDTAIRTSRSQNVFQFSSPNAWKSIDHDIKEFIVSIFYGLESKRLKMSGERISKPIMIHAPFDTSEERNQEMDSKIIRKKCLGRHYKHLGDIQLLLGMVSESLSCYNNALDMLVSANDSTWVGCALEGLCVVSAIILLHNSDGDSSSTGSKDTSVKFALDPRNLSTKQGPGLNWAEMKKNCIPSIKDLVDKYREAIINYSRYKNLAVIELEACIKATKVFAKAKKYLEASEFIQNAVYITLNVPESERLKRYSVMADLYNSINFHRKAFFYKRVAAMQCVAPQLKNPDWPLCNDLLMAAISNLSNDVSHFPYNIDDKGWPSVIQRVWRELVFSLERVGEQGLASLHLLHVFLSLYPYMNENDEKESSTALENYAKFHKVISMPPKEKFPFLLNFYRFPILKAVIPQLDVDGVRPIKSKTEKSPQSVFIYTPTTIRSKVQDHQKIQFDWCANTPCQIDVEVYNPLSFCSLQVTNFSFIADLVVPNSLDCPPVSFSVPAQMQSKIPVIITPLKPGKVKIVGYAFKVFGFSAKCYFEQNNDITTSDISMQVIPELPLLKWEVSAPDLLSPDDDRPVIKIHGGETKDIPIILKNIGHTAVSQWIVSSKMRPNDEHAMLLFDENFEGRSLDHGCNMALPVKLEPKCNDLRNPGLLSCTLSIKYAAEVANATWWRSINLEFNFKVNHSIILEKISITRSYINPNNFCTACVSLKSFLDTDATVFYNDITNHEINRKSINVSARSLLTFDVNVKIMKLPDKLEEANDLPNVVLNYLKQSLNFCWNISNGGNVSANGSVVYKGDFTQNNLSRILDLPVSCALTLNSPCDKGDGDITVPLGEMCGVTLNFSNLDTETQKFKVDLQVFQDQGNGYIEWDLDECVLILGCSSVNLSIPSSETSNFTYDVLFLKAGTYVIRASYVVTCFQDTKIPCFSPSIVLHAA